jgi:hypothetical protein
MFLIISGFLDRLLLNHRQEIILTVALLVLPAEL